MATATAGFVVGDRVTRRHGGGTVQGDVKEVLPGNWVRVEWLDVGFQGTTHFKAGDLMLMSDFLATRKVTRDPGADQDRW